MTDHADDIISKDIGKWNNEIINCFWESAVVAVSYLVHYNTLLQHTTDTITKCDSYFITTCDKILLQEALDILLQNVTVLL